MRPTPTTRLWRLCLPALLSGCASLEAPAPIPLEIPPALLTCPAAPTPPEPRAATQRDAALHLLGLARAHADCRDALGRVRGLVEAHRAP